MMTSYADIQSAVQAMKLGASDYVAKPVNPDELLKKISEAVKQPAASPKQTISSGKGESTHQKMQAVLRLPTIWKEKVMLPSNFIIM